MSLHVVSSTNITIGDRGFNVTTEPTGYGPVRYLASLFIQALEGEETDLGPKVEKLYAELLTKLKKAEIADKHSKDGITPMRIRAKYGFGVTALRALIVKLVAAIWSAEPNRRVGQYEDDDIDDKQIGRAHV